MIQIDHGIPIPPRPSIGRVKGTPGKRIYPWGAMGVGDSFVYGGTLQRAWSACWERHGYRRERYEARTLDGVVRIWRTA